MRRVAAAPGSGRSAVLQHCLSAMRLGFQGRNGIILVAAYRTVISRYAGMVTAHPSASSHEPGPSWYGIFAFLEEGERDSVSPIERLVVSQTTSWHAQVWVSTWSGPWWTWWPAIKLEQDVCVLTR